MRMRNSGMAALLLAACAVAQPPLTRVTGDPAALMAIAGTWEGDYWMEGSRDRTGTIHFRIGAAADTARAEVIMVSHRQQPPIIVIGQDPWTNPLLANQRLSINFVQASGDSIHGLVNPYTDPVCGCELRTSFRGKFRGDKAQGTFTSIHENGEVTGGRWRAQRIEAVISEQASQ